MRCGIVEESRRFADARGAIRDAKGWIRDRMPQGRKYRETLDQPALAAVFDLNAARSSDSFDKYYREVVRLIELSRDRGAAASQPPRTRREPQGIGILCRTVSAKIDGVRMSPILGMS
jgi:hypothetical protein